MIKTHPYMGRKESNQKNILKSLNLSAIRLNAHVILPIKAADSVTMDIFRKKIFSF